MAISSLVLAACEKSPPSTSSTTAAPTSASASAPAADDAQPPSYLCVRLNKLHNQLTTQITPVDPRECVQKFESARQLRPDLYPCLSLCVMRADDYATGAQCSGMCAPVENTCAKAGEKTSACEAKLKAVQANPSAKTIACVARCGNKFEKLPDVVDCMGAECGL